MNKIRFFDGGMGTMLQAAGLLGPGELPEPLNLTHPEEIAAIHQAYADAGAEFISTNTFGANGLKFDNVEELVQAATALVRRTGKKVVLDIGLWASCFSPWASWRLTTPTTCLPAPFVPVPPVRTWCLLRP